MTRILLLNLLLILPILALAQIPIHKLASSTQTLPNSSPTSAITANISR
jgi:hypothetical protein